MGLCKISPGDKEATLIAGPGGAKKPAGKGAGAWFKSSDDAAFDFARTYGDDSIATGREYGSSIYSKKFDDGTTMYAYTIPKRGPDPSERGKTSVDPTKPPAGFLIVATIHTHGNLKLVNPDEYKGANAASEADQKLTKKTGIPTYVVGPSGVLSVFKPADEYSSAANWGGPLPGTMLTTKSNNSLPRDKRDTFNPTDTNVVDEARYEKDPYID